MSLKTCRNGVPSLTTAGKDLVFLDASILPYNIEGLSFGRLKLKNMLLIARET
jgi:hypothetical protein